MKGSGIAPTQFTILKALAYAGEISQGTLGSVLAIDNTTLTRTVARLQERGWVDVRPGLDRRERRLRLTARGFHRLSRAEQRWKDAQERLLLLLGKKEWNRLHESLYRLTRSVLRP
jgi:DNA-binding MarR family transcriptional regulator